jgi:hypothetical protein
VSIALEKLWLRARGARWLNVLVANLRLLIGFAFLPAGLKKVLGQPFTAVDKHGPFHDFLHAFHATGGFYHFVGIMQLAVAVLLMTQRFAAAGALLALPIVTTIGVFCWSTGAYPTASVVTLMWLGTLGLALWDAHRWQGVLRADDAPGAAPAPPPPPLDARLWQLCGLAILALYLGVTAIAGEIYRPRGVELDNPAFYLLLAIPLFPVATFVLDQRRHRAGVPA